MFEPLCYDNSIRPYELNREERQRCNYLSHGGVRCVIFELCSCSILWVKYLHNKLSIDRKEDTHNTKEDTIELGFGNSNPINQIVKKEYKERACTVESQYDGLWQVELNDNIDEPLQCHDAIPDSEHLEITPIRVVDVDAVRAYNDVVDDNSN